MIDPDAVAAAATGLEVVERLSGGADGEVATYLPGRRVHGVRALGDRVEVYVALHWNPDLLAAADEVRAAVASVVDGAEVDVIVTDVVEARAADADSEV